MANIIKASHNFYWNNITLAEVTDFAMDFALNSEDNQSLQGRTVELQGARKIAVSLTFLRTDTETLRGVLPQYAIAPGQVMSTGEIATEGAIDLVPENCGERVYSDLEIESCDAEGGETLRIVNAYTEMDTMDYDQYKRTVTVRFIGEAEPGSALVQFFPTNSLQAVS